MWVPSAPVDEEMLTIGFRSMQPDLPQRLREEQPLRKYDPSTLYTPERAEGYIDQPAYAEEVARRDEL